MRDAHRFELYDDTLERAQAARLERRAIEKPRVARANPSDGVGIRGIAAKALDALADSYESDARRHDERAERLDWEA